MITSLFYSLLFILLVSVVYQDFTQRAVYWFIFPLIFLFISLIDLSKGLFFSSLKNGGFNLLFVLAQIIFVSLYFSVKERRFINIFNHLFGLGDLLFLISITTAFTVANYIAFYTISLFIILIFFLAFVIYKRDLKFQIPLAGAQAIVFLALLMAEATSSINLHDDSIIISYLSTSIK